MPALLVSGKAANQELMADEGGVDMLVEMLASTHPHLQRQASKALANLGVNTKNKERICKAGGVSPLVKLADSKSPGVAVEAVAALANLAVNGERSNLPTENYVAVRRGDRCRRVHASIHVRSCFRATHTLHAVEWRCSTVQ